MKRFTRRNINAYEMNTLSLKFLNVLKNNTNEYLINFYKQIEFYQNELSKTLGKESSDPYTKKIRDIDSIRDKQFIMFRDIIGAYTKTDEQEVAKAAVIVDTIIENRGYTLYSLGDDEETSALYVLFQELDKVPESVALIPGAAGALAKLKKAQADFDNITNEKMDTNSKKRYTAIAHCKENLDTYMNSLIEFLETTDEFFPDRVSGIIDKLNLLLSALNMKIESRKTRKENAAKESATKEKNISEEIES